MGSGLGMVKPARDWYVDVVHNVDVDSVLFVEHSSRLRSSEQFLVSGGSRVLCCVVVWFF